MVTKSEKDGIEVFNCEICNLSYKEKETAKQCEDWCRSHNNTCNFEISKKAI